MKGSKGSKGSTLDSTRPQTQDTEVAMRLARGGQAHSPRISLLIYHRKGIEAVTLSDGQRVVLGRDPSADVHIEDDSLSRAQAHFEVLEGEVFVEDLDSTNGTKFLLKAYLLINPNPSRNPTIRSANATRALYFALYLIDSGAVAEETINPRWFGRPRAQRASRLSG